MRRSVGLLAIGVLVVAGAGCQHDAAPLAPLAVEKIPAELAKAFEKAKPEIREVVSRLNGALLGKDFPMAFEQAQTLCGFPDENKAQRALAARAMVSLRDCLQTAQTQGDTNAALLLKYHQMTH